MVPGSYRVRVESTATDAVHALSGVVKVDIGATPPAITDIRLLQSIWHGGSSQRVTWETQGDVPQVHISLMLDDRYSQNLEIDIANTGSCLVTVPRGMVPGSYRVRVESTAADAVHALSGGVQIDDEHRERCLKYGTLLLGLPPRYKLPYAILRKVAVLAATPQSE